jgi:hypothetical protein
MKKSYRIDKQRSKEQKLLAKTKNYRKQTRSDTKEATGFLLVLTLFFVALKAVFSIDEDKKLCKIKNVLQFLLDSSRVWNIWRG